MMCPSRRDVLRAGGVTALLSGGLAGCIEDVTEPRGGDQPAYADWLFDTDDLLAASFRGFYAVDVATYRQQQAALPEAANEAVQRTADRYDGVAIEDFDRVAGLGVLSPRDDSREDRFLLTSVGTGSFDAADVGSAIEANSDVSAAGSYEGYDLYSQRDRYQPSSTAAAAVSDEAVVLSLADAGGDSRRGSPGETPPSPSGTPQGGVSATAAAKLHADAAAGEADGLLSSSDRLDRLAASLDGPVVGGLALDAATVRERLGISAGEEATGTPSRQSGSDGDPDSSDGPRTPTVSDSGTSPVARHLGRVTMGLTALGGSADASGANDGEVALRLLYESESAASDGADAVRDLREALRAEVDAFTVPEVEVATDGTMVAVTITGDPSAFYEELGIGEHDDPSARAPQVSFTFDRREDGRVTVTHDGGDTVASDTVGLLYESDAEGVERQWTTDDGSISAGDSTTTDQPVTGALRVIWNSEDGDASATLGLYRPPDDEGKQQDVPEAAFDFDGRSDGSLTVTHEGGDVIERGLVVRYDSTDGGETEKWAEEDGATGPGDTYTTRESVAVDGSVQVIWPGDERPVVLAEYRTDSAPRDRETATGTERSTATRTPTPVEDGTPTP